jgi:hypothetical protein
MAPLLIYAPDWLLNKSLCVRNHFKVFARITCLGLQVLRQKAQHPTKIIGPSRLRASQMKLLPLNVTLLTPRARDEETVLLIPTTSIGIRSCRTGAPQAAPFPGSQDTDATIYIECHCLF